MSTTSDNFIDSKINKIHKLYKINQFELAMRYKEMEIKKISEKIGRRKSKNLFLKVRHKGPALDSDIVNRDKNIRKLKSINEEEDNKNKYVEKKFTIEQICKTSSVFREYIETQKRNKENNKMLKTQDDFLNADFQDFLSKLNNEFDKNNEKFFRKNKIEEEIFNEPNRKFNSYHSDKYIFNKNYNRINLNKNKPIKLIKNINPSSSNNSFEKKKNIKTPNNKNSLRFSINSISKKELETKKQNEKQKINQKTLEKPKKEKETIINLNLKIYKKEIKEIKKKTISSIKFNK